MILNFPLIMKKINKFQNPTVAHFFCLGITTNKVRFFGAFILIHKNAYSPIAAVIIAAVKVLSFFLKPLGNPYDTIATSTSDHCCIILGQSTASLKNKEAVTTPHKKNKSVTAKPYLIVRLKA